MAAKKLTTEELVKQALSVAARAKALSDSASPGPWIDISSQPTVICISGPRKSGPDYSIEDGKFIIAARTLLPFLAELVAELADRVEAERKASADMLTVRDDLGDAISDLEETTKALERLRELASR